MNLAVKASQHTLVFTGVLDETVETSFFTKALDDIKDASEFYFDFGNVKRANSIGIWNYIKFISEIGKPITYKKCPVWLVEQFNINSDLIKGNKKVESFYAPYFHEDTEEEYSHLFVVGDNFEVKNEYDDEEFEEIEITGTKYICDFDSDSYFQFLEV